MPETSHSLVAAGYTIMSNVQRRLLLADPENDALQFKLDLATRLRHSRGYKHQGYVSLSSSSLYTQLVNPDVKNGA